MCLCTYILTAGLSIWPKPALATWMKIDTYMHLIRQHYLVGGSYLVGRCYFIVPFAAIQLHSISTYSIRDKNVTAIRQKIPSHFHAET
ncbi:hypothetical protein F5X97DRAFT_226730 [Nemania serpens]|nr:hypothetical protein F5X97DRAFT_226730 [Nemania serpens]